jgi:hypothetical protein
LCREESPRTCLFQAKTEIVRFENGVSQILFKNFHKTNWEGREEKSFFKIDIFASKCT